MQESQKYSLSEISLHASNKDCWLVIHGKVYDVTTFLEDHPGGDSVLLHASASGDATQSFEEVGHSSTATSMMESYLIGVLDGSDAGGGAAGGGLKTKGERVEEKANGPKPLLQQRNAPAPAPAPASAVTGISDFLLPVLVLAVAFAAWYYLTYYNTKP